MLKEFLSEAVSLLTEAVLGKPTRAWALQCPGQTKCCSIWTYGNCGSCGYDKRRGARVCACCNSSCGNCGGSQIEDYCIYC